MDLVDELLERYNESTDSDFGFHAWAAALFLQKSEFPAFLGIIEKYLQARGDDSVEPKCDTDTFTMPSQSLKDRFQYDVCKMAYCL